MLKINSHNHAQNHVFPLSHYFLQTHTKHQLKYKVVTGALNNNCEKKTNCEQEGFFYPCLPSGRHPDLRQNLEAPMMSDADCQKTEQGKSHRNSICVKFVKVFSRIFGVIFSLYSTSTYLYYICPVNYLIVIFKKLKAHSFIIF